MPEIKEVQAGYGKKCFICGSKVAFVISKENFYLYSCSNEEHKDDVVKTVEFQYREASKRKNKLLF